MKKRNKMLALLLASTMTVSAFAGGVVVHAEEEVEAETMSIFTDWLIWPLTDSTPNDPVMSEITKQTGVQLDFQPYMGTGDAKEALSVLVAGNELPDIVCTCNTELMNQMIDLGMVIPLDDLVAEKGSNLTEYCNDALNAMRLNYSDDGKTLYCIPSGINGGDYDPNQSGNLFAVRWDLYKQLEQPEINTLDDFLKLMQDMLALEPTNANGDKNYGLGLPLGEELGKLLIEKAILSASGHFYVNGIAMCDLEKDVLVPEIDNPDSIYWDAVEFYNKAYKMGILDPESTTMTLTQMLEKVNAGRYLASYCNWIATPDSYFVEQGTPEKGMVTIDVAQNDKYIYNAAQNNYGNQFKWMISSNCENPEKAMEFLNYLASYEANELILNGPEGLIWEYVDGVPTITEEAVEEMRTNPDFVEETCINKYINLMINGSPENPNGWKSNYRWNDSYMEKYSTDVKKDYMETKGYSYPMEGIDNSAEKTVVPFSLLSSLALDPSSDEALAMSSIKTYLDVEIPSMIFIEDEAEFASKKEEIIAKTKEMGGDEVFQAFYDLYESQKAAMAAME